MKFFDIYEIGVTMPSAIFMVAVTTISVSDGIRAFHGTIRYIPISAIRIPPTVAILCFVWYQEKVVGRYSFEDLGTYLPTVVF